VPAAGSISAREHLGAVMADLVDPPPARRLHQDTILHDALECRTPAMPRLVQLIQEMVRIGRSCREAGTPVRYPRRILADPQDGHHWPEERLDLEALYPAEATLRSTDRAALQAEIAHLRAKHWQDVVEMERLRRRIADPVAWLRAAVKGLVPGLRGRVASRPQPQPRPDVPPWGPLGRTATPAEPLTRRDGSDA
jgi:hypothetical protein